MNSLSCGMRKNPTLFKHEQNRLVPTKPEGACSFERKKIIIYKSPGIGDLIMSTAALRAFKKAVPSASIWLLTSEAAAKITPVMEGIDGVITIHSPWDKGPEQVGIDEIEETIKILRKEQFDSGVVLGHYDQDPLLPSFVFFLAGVNRRISYSREKPYHLLTDWIPDPEPTKFIRHQVEREIALLRSLGIPVHNPRLKLSPSRNDCEAAKKMLTRLGINLTEPVVLIHPGTTDKKRAYSSHGYVGIAHILCRRGFQVLFSGSYQEGRLIETIRKSVPQKTYSCAGNLTLTQFVGLISLVKLVITNNTGPAHIAAALNKPLIDLYARTNPQDTPWSSNCRVFYFNPPIQKDTSEREVPPSKIVKAAEELLSGKSENYIQNENDFESGEAHYGHSLYLENV